jgi:hypothetical protein
VACLADALIALRTPRARDPAESTGIYLAHPASKIHSAYLRIGVGPLRDGAAEVFIDGMAQRPRPGIYQRYVKAHHIRKNVRDER